MSPGTDRRRLLQVGGCVLGGGVATGAVSASVRNSQDDGVVVGTVTDESDDPIAGAAVALLDGSTEVASTETASTGQYGVAAAPGTYELTVEKDGYSSFSTEVTIETEGDQVTVDVTLSPPAPGAVFGVVSDESATPVEGVDVTLYDDGTEVASAETDVNGEYSITADPGSYGVTAWKVGFEPVTEEVTIEENQGTSLDIELPDGPPPLPDSPNPPLDLDGDGRFEDINGDGTFDIFDVQTLFDNLGSDAVQNNPAAFNFSGGDPSTVDIFDVQALFDKLTEGQSAATRR